MTRAGIWNPPKIEANWREHTDRYRRRDRKPQRTNKPKDSVTAGEVCELMRRWGR